MPVKSGYTRHPRHRELFKKPGSARWWAFVPNPAGGRMLREPTGHTDDKAAHGWYLDRIRRDNRAEPTAAATSAGKQRTLATALATRIDWLRAGRQSSDPTRKKLSAKTIEFYVEKSKPLVRLLGAETLLSSIGHEEIRRYIVTRSNDEDCKATTIAHELTTLSMAMRLARKDGVDCPVFKDIKPEDFAAVYVPKTRWLSESELDALVFSGVLLPKRAAVVAFLASTSATYPSEVSPVRPSHVDKKRYEVHLPGTKRASRNRKLIVPSHARRFFDFAVKHLEPSGFEPWRNIRGDLHDAARLLSMCERCRSERLDWARHVAVTMPVVRPDCAACKRTPAFMKLCPTDLRRTFAQWLVRSGVPYELAAPMMGHKDTKMLQTVYGKRDATAVADLVELALKKAPKGARKAS